MKGGPLISLGFSETDLPLPVVQSVENCDDQQRDLCGEKKSNDHHQHHRRPPGIFLSFVLTEKMEAEM